MDSLARMMVMVLLAMAALAPMCLSQVSDEVRCNNAPATVVYDQELYAALSDLASLHGVTDWYHNDVNVCVRAKCSITDSSSASEACPPCFAKAVTLIRSNCPSRIGAIAVTVTSSAQCIIRYENYYFEGFA